MSNPSLIESAAPGSLIFVLPNDELHVNITGAEPPSAHDLRPLTSCQQYSVLVIADHSGTLLCHPRSELLEALWPSQPVRMRSIAPPQSKVKPIAGESPRPESSCRLLWA